jgi:hypothetical protein
MRERATHPAEVTVVIHCSEMRKETVPLSHPRRKQCRAQALQESGRGSSQSAQQRGASAIQGSQVSQ